RWRTPPGRPARRAPRATAETGPSGPSRRFPESTLGVPPVGIRLQCVLAEHVEPSWRPDGFGARDGIGGLREVVYGTGLPPEAGTAVHVPDEHRLAIRLRDHVEQRLSIRHALDQAPVRFRSEIPDVHGTAHGEAGQIPLPQERGYVDHAVPVGARLAGTVALESVVRARDDPAVGAQLDARGEVPCPGCEIEVRRDSGAPR